MPYPTKWCPKLLTEYLCSQLPYVPDTPTREAIEHLIGVLHSHRPVGSNGKHGDLHTPTCGCDDTASPRL